jgi:hypothetical protein
MSAMQLINKLRRQTHEDDLESILHVVTWLALRYMPSDVPSPHVHLSRMFDEPDDGDAGGDGKIKYIMFPRILGKRINLDGNVPLTAVLSGLPLLFQSRYHDMDLPESERASPVEGSALLKIFDDALNATEWPAGGPNDRVPEELRTKQWTLHSAILKRGRASTQGSRKSEGSRKSRKTRDDETAAESREDGDIREEDEAEVDG